jgi:adenosine 3'-phospho 5'-phosphosulfate transporter B2
MDMKKTKSLNKIVSYKNWPPLFICSYSSLSNVLSSWFQYESLQYVSFTSQLLAKSSKSVFVMLTGKIVSNKNYKPYEYFCVCLIAFGIFLFSDINNKNANENNMMISTSLPGLICLLGYLITDSFTSTWQDNLIKEYSISSISLMFITNLYSCIYTFVSLLNQNEFYETIEFLNQHSDITHHVVLLSITSAIGQIFIFLTIQNFGALVFSLIMTTRQVLSILLSSIIFQHYLSYQSMFGIAIIFIALFLQQYFKFNLKK